MFSCEDLDNERDQEVWPASLLYSSSLILVDLDDHHWPSQFEARGYPKYPQGWLPYFPLQPLEAVPLLQLHGLLLLTSVQILEQT